MKLKTALALAVTLWAGMANAEKIALVNGTLINPATSQIVQDATIIIKGDKITSAGAAKAFSPPKDARDVALKNLKTLEDAGVTIAAGTDAGNIGTIHGPALFREFQLMKEAGLTPMQILRCATANAAKLFGGETGAYIGKIENGCFADLLILRSNPLNDIAHASDIDAVIKNSVVYPADSILH